MSAMPRIVRPTAGRRRLGSLRPPRAGHAWRAASAWRRTIQIRCTTVTVMATASAQRVTYSRIGRSTRSLRAGRHQDRHRAVRTLGDADRWPRMPRRLGPRPGVRRHRPHHQAVAGQARGRGSRRPARRSRAPARRRSRRRRSGPAWSRRRRRTVETRPVLRAIAPSMRSLNTNAVMNSTPPSRCPCGKKTSAPAHTPTVPTKVTTSGLMPEPDEQVDEGRQHDALPESS